MRKFPGVAIVVGFCLVGAGTILAGEYHSGDTLLCSDCHTMHFSQAHGFAGGLVTTTAAPGGDWLSAGPNSFLLKAPANQLCLACHDGQGFAPDVLGTNFNTSPTQGREAGTLNDTAGAGPYETWKGHTIGSTAAAPGFDPTLVGLAANWYDPAGTLKCISCHAQHGATAAYRNLGPSALGAGIANFQPAYVIGTANDPSKDVWINLSSYIAGSGSAATFNDFYSASKINFNRNDATVGSTMTSNRIDTFCASCHGAFHGGPGDTANIGPIGLNGFLRHPTSQVAIGAAGGEHSSVARFAANTTKVKVYTNDYSAYSNTSPGCITCHKSHGNQNPFGLVFLNGNATSSIDEDGGWAAGQTHDTNTGMRNLCGQCHSQG
jgi:hypothetical protein